MIPRIHVRFLLAAVCAAVPLSVSASTSDETSSALRQKARDTGEVRIIVQLKLETAMEGTLHDPKAVKVQQQSVARIQEEVLRAVGRRGIRLIKKYKHVPYLAAVVSLEALEIIAADPRVNSVIEDIPVPPTLADSVPLIGGNEAWALGYTGAGKTIAILDTGVDKTHSFLSGKVQAEACYSSGPVSLCPNGQTSQIGAGAGVNCSLSDDACTHGTHVAGIAAGHGSTFSGVAKDASLIAIQVFSQSTNSADCGGPPPCVISFESDQMLGLEHVFDLHTLFDIASANFSLGGGRFFSACDTDPLKPLIDQLRSVGILTSIASGNNGWTDSVNQPGCISTATTVGATTKQDTVTSYSNWAPFMDVFAPGDNIKSSVPGGGFATKSGTSMAAPHVAGLIALIKQADPYLSAEEIDRVIVGTSDDIGAIKGRINAGNAVRAAEHIRVNHLEGSAWDIRWFVANAAGGWSSSEKPGQTIIFIRGPGYPSLGSGWYDADLYKLTQSRSLTDFAWPLVFVRNELRNPGWSGANPNLETSYCALTSATGPVAGFTTFVYDVKYSVLSSSGKTLPPPPVGQNPRGKPVMDSIGSPVTISSSIGWFPAAPSGAACAYAVVGIPNCSVPSSGDWVVSQNCTLYTHSTAPGNVVVNNNAVLTIAPSGALDMDLASHHLLVVNGSKVIVKAGGKIE